MRFLAIDLGDKRTGLAIGDDETGLASPVSVIQKPASPGDELLRGIAGVIDEYGADELVLGLPLNMDGTEGPRARIVRSFSDRLGQETGLVVHLHDERLTSAAADDRMARTGLTHGQKKQRRDALAAAEILRDFLLSGRD